MSRVTMNNLSLRMVPALAALLITFGAAPASAILALLDCASFTQLAGNTFLRKICATKRLAAEQKRFLSAVLDFEHPASSEKEKKVRSALDVLKQNPGSKEFDGDEGLLKAISGYWTLNAVNAVLENPTFSPDQKAALFGHFAAEISDRTKGWSVPWSMVDVKNQRGDHTFLGALHCLVILNDRDARVFKGLRTYATPEGDAITDPNTYFANWDPRTVINKDIFRATAKAREN